MRSTIVGRVAGGVLVTRVSVGETEGEGDGVCDSDVWRCRERSV